MSVRAFVSGAAGLRLDPAETAFFAEAQPFGLILFRRNVESREQVRALVDEFRSAVGRHAPVLIDQEGGRVQRLTAPVWHKAPSAARVAKAAREGGMYLAWIAGRLIAADLAEVGIDVDCAPCLDLQIPGQSEIIGDRSFGEDPETVAELALAFALGLEKGGVMPVIKHMPGHGRALVDSHERLPVVDAPHEVLAATDFAPFRTLARLPAAMTAHVVYTAIDPAGPATTSRRVIDTIIRGEIGFDGLLFSDDVSMGALSGTIPERALRCLDAGCDVVLHCNGSMDEMTALAGVVPALTAEAERRAAAALATIRTPDPDDLDALRAELALALAAAEAPLA
ncbi:beta-N-acetylhexosaminidase [Methylobrevis albus]|uniref:beta-N-acetylhexosaminidase n=1 Tax=Methylobrevis albus TaxID=2793297 RepID=A0A931I511_9HYPH|nr:beta-N-acetylhexosaminidase [Methylobrevis albus]MBH0238963.1 beta-N-acetylhexosaminidase [Methylobrevis albus]